MKVKNPCTDILTDIEYLNHMIPHHQVAIDMSLLLIEVSNNPQLLYLCRNIIKIQEYEIWEMGNMQRNLSNDLFTTDKWLKEKKITTLDKFAPILSKSKDGSCNPLFFKPDDHSEHMQHMKINDKNYLEHMIPHHQVAIDMSKRLLLHTNNSYLLQFANNLIIEQQGEIFLMNNLLNNKFNQNSILT